MFRPVTVQSSLVVECRGQIEQVTAILSASRN
jgi:hypothetical protein